jgi:dihydropteroate synthase
MAEEGADIVDVGGESTRPGAEPVSEDEEIARVLPVIRRIREASDVPISIDTTKARVARAAIDAGADMINDISAGRFDEGMLPLAAAAGLPVCLMHMKGTPRTMQADPRYGDVMGEIASFLRESVGRAVEAGVAREAVIVDPGIGFGKTVEHNLTILRRLAELRSVGAPLLVGASRKSFIGKLLDVKVNQRLEGTLAAVAASVRGGARILRVHDVGAVGRFIRMYLALAP